MRKEIKWPNTVPENNFSLEFVQGMADRMAVSYFKYGPLEIKPKEQNTIKSLELRLKRYKETGNTEYLMDAANYAMIEFMMPRHPKAHFKAEDSSKSPGNVWDDGEISQRANDYTPQGG